MARSRKPSDEERRPTLSIKVDRIHAAENLLLVVGGTPLLLEPEDIKRLARILDRERNSE